MIIRDHIGLQPGCIDQTFASNSVRLLQDVLVFRCLAAYQYPCNLSALSLSAPPVFRSVSYPAMLRVELGATVRGCDLHLP